MTHKANEGWTRLDNWTTGAAIMSYSAQTLQVTTKGKCCAFGEAIVGAGRAEWDLKIEFESFGGICFGLYRHDLRNKHNLNELPVDDHFAYTPNGYGYTNKTGAVTHNGERKKYGQRYRNGDIVTIRLDLMSRDLTFLVNGESQGVAFDNLPKGVYRLAVKLQFKEQKVAILKLWTSLGKETPELPSANADSSSSSASASASASSVANTNTNTNTTSNSTETGDTDAASNAGAAEDDGNSNENGNAGADEDNENSDSNNVTENGNATEDSSSYSRPKADDDADWFASYGTAADSNNSNDEDKEDDEEYVVADSDDEDEKRETTLSNEDSMDDEERQQLSQLEISKPVNRRMPSNEDLSKDIINAHRRTLSEQLDKLQEMNESDINAEETSVEQHVGLISGGSRARGSSTVETFPPKLINIEKKDEDATDFFSKSGPNLSTQSDSVTCSRQSNSSSLIHSAFGTQLVTRGRMIWKIKVEKGHSIQIGVCGLQIGDELFTNTQYGFGYGDDGNIYFGGASVEYNTGYKVSDVVSVVLDMDMKTLTFSVNDVEHGDAFDSLPLNATDGVSGYRLAVSLRHRPHKISLIESTLFETQRLSPRPQANQFNTTHKRGISWTTLDAQRKLKTTSNSNSTNNSNALNDAAAAAASASTSANGNTAEAKEDPTESESKEDAESTGTPKMKKKKSSKAGGKKGNKGNKGKKSKTKAKTKTGAGAKTTGKSTKVSKANKNESKPENTGSKATTKKAKKTKKSKKAETNNNNNNNNNSDGNTNTNTSHQLSKRSKSSKKVIAVNWVKRENVKRDAWEAVGKKMSLDKTTIATKPDIKDSQSAIGKLVIKKNIKAKWDLLIKQGDKIGIGVINMTGGLKSAKNRKILNSCFSNNINGYGYMGNDGGKMRSGRYQKYGEKFKAGDKMSIILDMRNKTLMFVKNGKEQGIAFKNLPIGEYRLAVTLPEKWHRVQLTKTSVWDC